MDLNAAVSALGALAQEHRLALFRLWVRPLPKLANLGALTGLALLATQPTAASQQQAPADPVRTITGIALDAPWKIKLYGFAREQLKHPAWGWTHSERDFLLASKIAERERLAIKEKLSLGRRRPRLRLRAERKN